MYNSNKFTSDLMNSYAWDTAITFIQKCTNQTKYSYQQSLNTSLSQTGTTNDKQCNIFDMANNVVEWTTETSDDSSYPCVNRTGRYILDGYVKDCINFRTSYSPDTNGFRPLLFVNV